MVRFFMSVLLVYILVLLKGISAKVTHVSNPVERPLRVGSFNIQKLGESKMEDAKVMNIVKKVILRYDLILIQEIVTDENRMSSLLQDVNKLTDPRSKYLMQISGRLGRDKIKEQYAFLYRSDKLVFQEELVYPDDSDEFMRPPYTVRFYSPTLRGVTSFVAIGIHTQPKNAANETSALAKVYDHAKTHYGTEDAIIMGDMNAGCNYVRIGDWENIDLWTRPEFVWLIKHDTDTTVSDNCCPYDRIVVAGTHMEDVIIWDSIGVYKYQDVYGLSTEQVKAVSDHWPVEVSLKGKFSEEVDKNLQSRLCVSIEDGRERSLPPAVMNQRTTMGFVIYLNDVSVLMERESSDVQELLVSLKNLKNKYPLMISEESVSAASYKVMEGALRDVTVHQDNDSPQFWIQVEFELDKKLTSIHVCVRTSIS